MGSNRVSFEEFLESVHQESDTGIFIVDGDVPLLDMDAVEAYYEGYVLEGGLIVHRSNGADAAWRPEEQRQLTYCVSTQFGANYGAVVQAMNAAARAWEYVADIDFIHSPAADGNCTADNGSVVFDVRPTAGQRYLARAFFPNYPRSVRNVLIDGSSFGNLGSWTLTGILRHELGHALGFRHEHTRPEAGGCYEDNSWRALTPYDSKSVMHYPHCPGGTQTGDLVVTATDGLGARLLYGHLFDGPDAWILNLNIAYATGPKPPRRHSCWA